MFVSQMTLKDMVCWALDGPCVLVAGETSPAQVPTREISPILLHISMVL